MFVLVTLFCLAFLIQYALTFLQMQNFNVAYRSYRRRGYRAAIGKFAGKFHAGAIVMFAIDKNGTIVEGTAMQGVTTFARFKDFDVLNGKNVGALSAEDCKALRLSYPKTKAVLDCAQNYNTIMQGGEVPVPPSPLTKAGLVLQNAAAGSLRRVKNVIKGVSLKYKEE